MDASEQIKKFPTISADKLLPLGVQVEEESPYPTLEEAASMAAQSHHFTNSTTTTSMDYEMDDAMPSTSNANNFCEDASSTITQKKNIKQYIGHTIPKDFLMKSGLLNSSNGESDSAEPLYKVNSDGSVIGFLFIRQYDTFIITTSVHCRCSEGSLRCVGIVRPYEFSKGSRQSGNESVVWIVNACHFEHRQWQITVLSIARILN